MTRDDAKRILLIYRPGSTDHQDPEVAEALALAREDHELRGWLQDQGLFQKSVRSGLRQIAVPPGLREAILAGREVVIPLWRRPEWLLLAACLVLGLVIAGLAISRTPSEATLAGFRSRMVSFAIRVYRMDIVTPDPNAVRQFLESEGAPADYTLTPGLAQIPVKGGARLSWQNRPVSMICFALPKGRTLYMFVMDQGAIADADVLESAPTIRQVHGMPTATWQRGGKIYLIAAPADAVDLRKLVTQLSGPKARLVRLEWRGPVALEFTL